MVGYLNLLLIGDNAYLCLSSSLFLLIFGEIELNGILTLVNLCCVKCGYTNVNRDDGFYPVSQLEWGFSHWDTLGSPVRP